MLTEWRELGTPGGRVMASSRAASILKVFSLCRAYHKICLTIPAAVISCRLGTMHTCTESFHCSVRRSGADEAGGEGTHPRTRVVGAASYWFVDAAPSCDGDGADVAIIAEWDCAIAQIAFRRAVWIPMSLVRGVPAGDADEASH